MLGTIVFITEPPKDHPDWLDAIDVMRPDGRGVQLVPISNALCCVAPALSPPGNAIVAAGEGTLTIASIRGADVHDLVPPVPIGGYSAPAWSPSGTEVAFWYSPSETEQSEIDVVNADGSNRRMLTQVPGVGATGGLAWSPDGSELAFVAPSGAIEAVSVPDGAVRTIFGPEQGQGPNEEAGPLSWAPGNSLLFTEVGKSPDGVWEIDPSGGRPRPVLPRASTPSWGPDGVHFVAVRDGRIVMSDPTGKVQATIGPPHVTFAQWGGPEPFLTPLSVNVAANTRFTDTLAILNYPLALGPAPSMGATVDWGDSGGGSAHVQPVEDIGGTILHGLGLAAFSISGEHVYRTLKPDPISVKVMLNGFGTALSSHVPVTVVPLAPQPEALSDPLNPSDGDIALLVPTPPSPLQSPIVSYEWRIPDDDTVVLDDPSSRDEYTQVLAGLADDPGRVGLQLQAQSLGIIPPFDSYSDDEIRQIVGVWQTYFPMHVVPHIFHSTGLIAVNLREIDERNQAGESDFSVNVTAKCKPWGGGYIPGLDQFNTCETAAGFSSVAHGPGRFPPDYVSFQISPSGLKAGVFAGSFSLTITHDGHMFLGFSAGPGLGLASDASVALGYVGPPDSPDRPDDKTIDGFVTGWSIPVGVQIGATIKGFVIGGGLILVLNTSTGTGGAEYILTAPGNAKLSGSLSLQAACSVPIGGVPTSIAQEMSNYEYGFTGRDSNQALPPLQNLTAFIEGALTALYQNCILNGSGPSS